MSTDTATGAMQDTILKAVQEAVKDASTRGWEAIVLVLVMLGLIALTGFIIKWLIGSMDKRMVEATAREERMAKRLTELETFAQTTLMKVVNDTSALAQQVIATMEALTSVLKQRICLLDATQQDSFVNRVGDRIGERLTDERRGQDRS